MKKQILTFAFLIAGLAAPVLASTITYTAALNSLGEVPQQETSSSGVATLSLSGDLLTVDVTYRGLSSLATAADIYCCVSATSNGPVVLPLSGFPTAETGAYNQTFNLSTFVFSGGGSEAALISGLNSGLAYVNIRSVAFPNGEIRGQLAASASSAVPEPTNLILLGMGVVGVWGATRRRLFA